MTLAFRVLIALGGLGLAAAIALAIPQSGALVDEVRALLAPTWGVTTFADLYLGFVISAAIILSVEPDKRFGAAWALGVLVMGNVVTAVWAIWRLGRLTLRKV